MKQSELFKLYYVIDGSEETPKEWAYLSPRERDIAKPGPVISGNQILYGPRLNPL